MAPKRSQSHSSDPSYGRRNFLKHSVVSLGVAVQEYVKHRDASLPKKTPDRKAERTDWLRPPGAVEEALFLERCTACGECLKACPHGTIISSEKDETPIVFPDRTPCYLCEDFPCVSACETDALQPPAQPRDVRMGIAVVSHRMCSASQGCHACVPQCPTQALALDFSAFRIQVQEEQCVGCGICEHICKTVNDRVVAIRVVPERSRRSAEAC